MTDGTANLKGRKFTELKIAHFNGFCASLTPAIYSTLTPTMGSQQVRGMLAPTPEQGFVL